MKNIAIYGGSFDPPHIAHLELAKSALNSIHIDTVIFMPANIQPLKKYEYEASDYHRVSMIKLLIEKEKNITYSLQELESNDVSYTYNTLMKFKERNEECKLYFIIGTDSLLQFHKWYRYQDILKNFSLIIGNRKGCDISKQKELVEHYTQKYNAEIIVLKDEISSISSTMIRDAVINNEDLSDYLPPKIERYIKDNDLY